MRSCLSLTGAARLTSAQHQLQRCVLPLPPSPTWQHRNTPLVFMSKVVHQSPSEVSSAALFLLMPGEQRVSVCGSREQTHLTHKALYQTWLPAARWLSLSLHHCVHGHQLKQSKVQAATYPHC